LLAVTKIAEGNMTFCFLRLAFGMGKDVNGNNIDAYDDDDTTTTFLGQSSSQLLSTSSWLNTVCYY